MHLTNFTKAVNGLHNICIEDLKRVLTIQCL